jgi:hypothetical protein
MIWFVKNGTRTAGEDDHSAEQERNLRVPNGDTEEITIVNARPREQAVYAITTR